MVVVPDGVEDRRADVPLVAAEVRLPPPGQRVEVDGLRLLLPVAAALPRVHRPAVAACARGLPGLADPSVAVHEQSPRDQRQPVVEEGVDEELVPEDVPAIRLAVEAACGHAGVVVRGLPRAHLQQVCGVEAQQELDALLARERDVADLPELVPGAGLADERLVEGGIPADALDRRLQRLADASVARAVERDVLLHPDRHPLVQLERQHLLDVVLRLVGGAYDVELLAAAEDARAGGLGDLDARLAGARLERDHVAALDPRALRVEVAALEVAVAGDALVDHAAVERRDDLDPAGPVLRREVPGDRRLVHAVHAHEAAAAQAGLPAVPVAEGQLADHQRVPEVVHVPVGEELDVGEAERLVPVDAELQREPVREVDEVLVGHRVGAHDGRPPVVDPVRVRARVVDVVRVLPLRAAPRAEVAVAGRRERLAQPFLRGLEPVVDELEVAHGRPRSGPTQPMLLAGDPARRAAQRRTRTGPSSATRDTVTTSQSALEAGAALDFWRD